MNFSNCFMENQYLWKRISDLKEFEISNSGMIRNALTKKLIPHCQTKNGYLKTNIFHQGKRYSKLIHRIVIREFLFDSTMQVNHIDGNKHNNNLSNLEYVTQSENIKHAFLIGIQNHKGEKNPAHKLTAADVREIRKLSEERKISQRKLARMYSTSQGNISKIINRKKWSCVEEAFPPYKREYHFLTPESKICD